MSARIPETAIRCAYLWPCNLAHAAFTLSKSWSTKITAHDLDVLFDAHCVNHPLLHELGARPVKGFDQANEHVKLAKRLMEDDHNACAEL
ncbi:hypothetical protein ASD45_08445 [Pseudolabrys sp. Root1462]|uniref:hypothetical protein n=1 Tax=Pseudolabrys sp. Root1462 TaxID=1736466 RepID=UPI000703454C|nr:hypothetical protein [Pseudolabrys sp. Root1462]KQZ00882.1 hypothetical protein ASD45_08445 [Pseudolabrys sp. Root1462]